MLIRDKSSLALTMGARVSIKQTIAKDKHDSHIWDVAHQRAAGQFRCIRTYHRLGHSQDSLHIPDVCVGRPAVLRHLQGTAVHHFRSIFPMSRISPKQRPLRAKELELNLIRLDHSIVLNVGPRLLGFGKWSRKVLRKPSKYLAYADITNSLAPLLRTRFCRDCVREHQRTRRYARVVEPMEKVAGLSVRMGRSGVEEIIFDVSVVLLDMKNYPSFQNVAALDADN